METARKLRIKSAKYPMNSWRLLLSGFNDLYTNMAIDEALFIEHCLGNNLPTLRIYGWNPASFSFGYFQDPEQELDLAKCRRENIPLVRRMTGGGVIFHNTELTYSLVCSKEDLRIGNIKESYRVLCSFIINAYRKLGLKAAFAKDVNLSKKDSRKFSHFCFASNEEYDIVIEGRKIGGNAQRRRKNVVFQHGSIPLTLDIDEILNFLKNPDYSIRDRVSSLNDLLDEKLNFGELKEILIGSFKRIISSDLTPFELNEDEKKLVQGLKKKKYSTDNWNYYRIDDSAVREKEDVRKLEKTCLVR